MNRRGQLPVNALHLAAQPVDMGLQTLTDGRTGRRPQTIALGGAHLEQLTAAQHKAAEAMYRQQGQPGGGASSGSERPGGGAGAAGPARRARGGQCDAS